ncbi:uncharacterized protein [Cherax quadricarinatus]|uniref:uncharacterized protein n=1 Tax=Cherax quadricarinatus TaxID=27406 RepID=UPI00387E5F57
MTEKADMPGDTVSLPPTYAPSEAYSESPPPAYRRDKSNRVQIVKMVCVTVVASALIIGFFIITSNYLSSRSCNCHQEKAGVQKLQAASFLEIPRAEELVDHSLYNNKVDEKEVDEKKVDEKKVDEKQTKKEKEEEEVKTSSMKEVDTVDDATLPSVEDQLPLQVVPLPQEEVEALVEEAVKLEEGERELEAEERERQEEELERQENRQALRDIMRAQMDHMKKIKLPIDLILGNPALAGRDVNCEVERREQPLGNGIMTQAIIVTCRDNDDNDNNDLQEALAGPVFPPPGARPPSPPLSLIAPIMKMLTAKAASRAIAKQLIPVGGPRFLPFPGAPIQCSANGPIPCVMTPIKQMNIMAGHLSGPIPIPANMPPQMVNMNDLRIVPFPGGLPQLAGPKNRLIFTPLNAAPSEPRRNLFNGPPAELRINPFSGPPSELRINPFSGPPSELRINPFNAPPSEPRMKAFNVPPVEMRINPFSGIPSEPRMKPFNGPPSELRINPFNGPPSEPRMNPFNGPPSDLRINAFNAPPSEPRMNPFNGPPSELRINPFNAPPSEPRINPFNGPPSEPRMNPFNGPPSEPRMNPFNGPPSELRISPFNAPLSEPKINPFNGPSFLERKNAQFSRELKAVPLNLPSFPEPRAEDGPRHRMLPFPFRPLIRMSPRMPRILLSQENKEGPISLASLHRGALPLPTQPEGQRNFILPTPEAKSRALSSPVNLPTLRLLPGTLVAPAPSVTVGERREERGPITHMEMQAPNLPSSQEENQPRALDFGPPRVHTLINHAHPDIEPVFPADMDVRPIPKDVLAPPEPIAIIPQNVPIAGAPGPVTHPSPKFDPQGRTGIVPEINPDAEIVIKPLSPNQEPPSQEEPRQHHLLIVN